MSKGDMRFLGTLLGVHVVLCTLIACNNFIVIDEIAHIPSGIYHWKTGLFYLDRVNPPLARMLAVLPTLPLSTQADYEGVSASTRIRQEWSFGYEFMRSNLGTFPLIVKTSRWAGVAWSCLGCWVVFAWSDRLYGRSAAKLAATFWSLDPNVLAIATIATADMASAVASMCAMSYFVARSWAAEPPSARELVVAGSLLGMAQLAKYTCLVLYPIVLLIFARGMLNGKGTLRFLELGVVVLVSLFVINSAYLFRGSMLPAGSFRFTSTLFSGGPGNRIDQGGSGNVTEGTWLGKMPVPLPADYLCGIDLQARDFEKKFPSYLRGEWRERGWWYYYIYSFLVKSPHGVQLAMLSGCAAFLLIGRDAWRPGLIDPVLCSAGFLLLVSINTGFNHHSRYAFPAYAFAFVPSGAAIFRLPRRIALPLSVMMASWVALSTLRHCPHELSYFNELAGGPTQASTHLVDSNVDWGQDLERLAEWARSPEGANGGEIGLAVHHLYDPRALGISFHVPPAGPDLRDGRPPQPGASPELSPGFYAVSINHLMGMETYTPDGKGGLYPASHGDFTYFQRMVPVGRVGYSILIFEKKP